MADDQAGNEGRGRGREGRGGRGRGRSGGRNNNPGRGRGRGRGRNDDGGGRNDNPGRGRSGGRGRGSNSKDDEKNKEVGATNSLDVDTQSKAVKVQSDGGRGKADGRGRGRGEGRGRGKADGRGRGEGRGRGRSSGEGRSSGRGGRDGGDGEKGGQGKSKKKGSTNQASESMDNNAEKNTESGKNAKDGSKEDKGGKSDDAKKQQQSGNKNDNEQNKGNNNKSQKSGEGKQAKGKDKKANKNETAKKDNKSKPQKKVGYDQPLAPSVPPSQPQQTSDINYGSGDTITLLHIGEKPSIAEAIARGLSNGSSNKRSKILPVHDFVGPSFPRAPHAAKCKHKVTSVAGHVFSVDFPAQFQSWDSVDPAELFGAPIVRKPTKGSVVKHLQDEARGVDFIVLWMDCDREGENINFEVLDCCMHLMKSGGSSSNFDRVYRAHFSAINPSDIKKAYNALGKPDRNQSLSVDARQELDLKVGVAFSRFQTRFFQGRYGDLDSSVLSYGPCQTPTMGFCVQRHIEIETFKPEPYWVLELGVTKRGRVFRALWNSGRSFKKSNIQKLQEEALSTSPVVEVKNVITKEKKQARPIPLNTISLLKACSKALGLGPHAAMQTAERLYLSGYLSYPRTESTAYPKSFDIKGTLQQQAGDSRWGANVRSLLQEGHTKSRGGVDMGDHPPITPCRSAGPSELSGDMARVYDLVVRHFIASVSPDAVWRSTRVDFEIAALGDKGGFTLTGKELVSPGFLSVLLHKEYGDVEADADEDEEERAIPEFEKGEVIALANATTTDSGKVVVASGLAVRATLDIKEKMTTCPGYLTESELIGLMEKNGIGTDASIATHIENIQKRNYVELASGRRLIPTKLGLVLAQGYHLIDSSLVLPQVRSDIEDQCNKIAKGLASKDDVVERAIQLFGSKFEYFVKNIDKMDILFGSSFSKLEDIGKPFTRCGLSRRYLQFIPGPPQRLYNKWTEMVFPLPLGGTVKQWSGRVCSVEGCNFELCLYSVGQPERTFPLCPNCFNKPEWALQNEEINEAEDKEDGAKERQIQRIAGKALCLECPLPDEHPLIEEMTVSPDPDSDGVLILDPHFGPKWRLVSTRDPTIIYLPNQEIDKVTVLDKTDEVLGTHLMQIDFKSGKSPLPGGETKHISCFANDELLQSMVRVHHGSERTKGGGRGGRGRGRGGRGRGRGGGRGRGRR